MLKFNVQSEGKIETLEGTFVAVDPISKLIVIGLLISRTSSLLLIISLENEESFSIVFPGQISSMEGELTGQVSDDESILNMKSVCSSLLNFYLIFAFSLSLSLHLSSPPSAPFLCLPFSVSLALCPLLV
jgi:hypothetical protein